MDGRAAKCRSCSTERDLYDRRRNVIGSSARGSNVSQVQDSWELMVRITTIMVVVGNWEMGVRHGVALSGDISGLVAPIFVSDSLFCRSGNAGGVSDFTFCRVKVRTPNEIDLLFWEFSSLLPSVIRTFRLLLRLKTHSFRRGNIRGRGRDV